MPADPSLAKLVDEIAALRAQLTEQGEAHAAVVDHLKTIITLLQEDNQALKEKVRQLSGGGRVRLASDANQLSIFGEPVTLGDDSEDDGGDDEPPTGTDQPKRKRSQRRGARRLDTSQLPREERTIEKPESQRICPVTGIRLVPVGEELVHEVAYTRGSCRLIVHRRIRYGLPPELASERKAA